MKPVAIIGDTHGQHKKIVGTIERLDIRDGYLLHVGDFGIGFQHEPVDRADLRKLSKILTDRNLILYVIRGNHDKPEYFDGKWSKRFKNIHLLPDYSIIDINGENVLMVGGAISIDRKDRLRKMQKLASMGVHSEQYWFDEPFILDVEKLEGIRDISYVITHSAPNFVGPTIKGSDFVENAVNEGDTELINDLNEEREKLTTMYDVLRKNNDVKRWFFGHFHRSIREEHDNTLFIGLDINQFFDLRQ